MITQQNYFTHFNRLDFASLPDEMKQAHLVIMTHTNQGHDWSRMEQDTGFRTMAESAFKKLDEYIQSLAGVSLDGVPKKPRRNRYAGITKEVLFIQRFLDFHDRILYKKTFEIFIDELQEAIGKKQITKKSPVAKEILAIQQAAVNAYNNMYNAKHFVLKAATIKRLKGIIEKYENAYDDIDQKQARAKKKSIGLQGLDGIEGKIMSSTDFANMQFDTIGLQGKWKELIGDPCEGFTAMVYGKPKMGKSYLCIDLAGYLARHHGDTLYVAKEEKLDATLQQKLKDKDVAHPSLFVSDYLPADLSAYQYIFLDSVNKLGLTPKDIEALKASNPGKSFIFIFQTIKDGNFRGGNQFQHDVDVVIEIPEKGKAVQFGRFNQGGEMEVFGEAGKTA